MVKLIVISLSLMILLSVHKSLIAASQLSDNLQNKIKPCNTQAINQKHLEDLGNIIDGRHFNRIVSLSLASDEILYSLLQSKNSLSRLVAVSNLANNKTYSFLAQYFTKYISNQSYKPTIVQAKLEDIVLLQPDLIVVASFNNQKLLHGLKNILKKQFYVAMLSDFSTIDDIRSNILYLASLISACDHANFLLSQSLDKITSIAIKNTENKDKDLNIKSYSLSVIPKNPNTDNQIIETAHKQINKSLIYYDQWGYFFGQNTLFNDLIVKMGFINTVQTKGWIKLANEALIKLKPDYIVGSCQLENTNNTIKNFSTTSKQKLLLDLKSHQAWKYLSSVINNRIICVDQKAIMSTSHNIYQAYLQIKSQIHLFR